MSNQKYEALNMKEFVVRRTRGEPGERFRLFMITTMHADKVEKKRDNQMAHGKLPSGECYENNTKY